MFKGPITDLAELKARIMQHIYFESRKGFRFCVFFKEYKSLKTFWKDNTKNVSSLINGL